MAGAGGTDADAPDYAHGPWGRVPGGDARHHSYGREIPCDQLTAQDVPPRGADWSAVFAFALTYNGYARFDGEDGYAPCARLANTSRTRWDSQRELPETLIDLRTCLFYEQRRYRHFGILPAGDDARYIGVLVDAIRSTVSPES